MDDKAVTHFTGKTYVSGSASVAARSPRNDEKTRNPEHKNFMTTIQPQKKNDQDAVSIFSQAIDSVRSTKGKLLKNTLKKTSIIPAKKNAISAKDMNIEPHSPFKRPYKVNFK